MSVRRALSESVEGSSDLCEVFHEPPIVPSKSQELLSLRTDVGVGQVVTFSVLEGSVATPSREMM